MFSYNALVTEKEERLLTETVAREEIPQQQQPIIETNTAQENLKFPFDEALLDQLTVLQDFYDLSADAKTRENALLVFKQTFSTSSGMSLAINSEPFEVLAAMSGVVTKIKMDAFTGNSITIQHANGMETRYSSITDIVVKEGDEVVQGQPLATTMDNDWNPTAGIHLHFEVLEDGEAINPRKLLAF